ncbi:MAG: hypothetical protein M3Y08_17270 [Fibrobacterota bacterium]|nr:hypothetical protein [Fibrobacterota bacterium]
MIFNSKKVLSVFLFLVIFRIPALSLDNINGGPPGTGWTKEFEDNFDGNAIDPAKWDVLDQVVVHPSGLKSECLSLARNVTVGNGICSLTTKREQIDSFNPHCQGP